MLDTYVVWGDPEDPQARIAVRRSFNHSPSVVLVNEARFAALDVGPIPVTGPVIWSEREAGRPSALMVLADQSIPEWAIPTVLADWGWQPVTELPEPQRTPYQVDVLLLAPNWAGAMDGWSATVWLESPVRPMQRLELEVDPVTGERVPVRVLEVGEDGHGVPYVVMFCPDRDVVDAVRVTEHGWRREPWVRVRRQSWSDLADLADSLQVDVTSLFGRPVIRHLIVDDVRALNADAFGLLPVDVRDALEQALREGLDDEE